MASTEHKDGDNNPPPSIKELLDSFKHASPGRRNFLITQFRSLVNSLTEAHQELLEKEKEKFRETYGINPGDTSEKVIGKVFRGKDGYLNFDTLNPSDMPLFSDAAIRLLNIDRAHIEQFGQNSVAHLNFSENVMTGLTRQGVYLVERSGPATQIFVNTIDELRNLLGRLSQSADLRICRKEMWSQRGEQVTKYRHIAYMQPTLTRKLADWDERQTSESPRVKY